MVALDRAAHSAGRNGTFVSCPPSHLRPTCVHTQEPRSHRSASRMPPDKDCSIHSNSYHNNLLLQFAYGRVQNNLDDIIRIQEAIDVLCSSPSPSLLIFILGVTNHWVTLCAYSTPVSRGGCGHTPSSPTSPGTLGERGRPWVSYGCAEGECKSEGVTVEKCSGENVGVVRCINKSVRVERYSGVDSCSHKSTHLICLDSNNVDVLCASDKDIDALVKKKEEERMKRKDRGYSDWERLVVTQAFRDQRDVVTLLCACLSGQGDLLSHMLNSSWLHILESFQEHVERMMPGSEGEELFLPLLLQWLECQHQPASLRDVQVGS